MNIFQFSFFLNLSIQCLLFSFYFSKDEGSPCSLNHLIDSHFALLKVVNEANDNFGMLIGSYFATQVLF